MQFIVGYVSKSMLVAQTLNLLILPLTAQIVYVMQWVLKNNDCRPTLICTVKSRVT